MKRICCDSHAVVLMENEQGEPLSIGRKTSLENLMLLCTKHHTLVHEGGFCIERDFQNRWYFSRPDGIAVPASGYRSSDTDKMPPAGGLLSVAEKTVSEPAVAAYLH